MKQNNLVIESFEPLWLTIENMRQCTDLKI